MGGVFVYLCCFFLYVLIASQNCLYWSFLSVFCYYLVFIVLMLPLLLCSFLLSRTLCLSSSHFITSYIFYIEYISWWSTVPNLQNLRTRIFNHTNSHDHRLPPSFLISNTADHISINPLSTIFINFVLRLRIVNWLNHWWFQNRNMYFIFAWVMMVYVL